MNVGEDIFVVCARGIQDCVQSGLLKLLKPLLEGRWSDDDAEFFKFAQWQGDAELRVHMQRYVRRLQLPLADSARLVQFSVSNASQASLFAHLRLGRRPTQTKKRADIIEAIVWELSNRSEIKKARDALQDLTAALATIGTKKLEQPSRDLPDEQRPHETQQWLRLFEAEREEQYSHTSLRGG